MKKPKWICFSGLVILILACLILTLHVKTAREIARLRSIAGKSFFAPSVPTAIADAAVSYAKSMLGKPYDPLMGRFGDPFGKIGFVVCIDVPVRAYEAAGIAMPALLREAAREHKAWFSIGPNNPPSSSFFYRRVRNYHPLFRNHPQLIADSKPRLGDWAFYGKTHIALVIDVKADGQFSVIEASPVKGRVAVSDADYMTRTWGPPAFFGRLRAAQ